MGNFMNKKRYKDKRRISKIYLIIILNVTIFMSILGYKVFAGKTSSIVMSTNLKENYMSALSYDGSETDNSKERVIQTDKDYI